MDKLCNFLSRVYQHTKPHPCGFCKTIILTKYYEKHCQDLHNINPKIQCVFCNGKYSWSPGKKWAHVDHLSLCFERFKRRSHQSSSPPSSIPTHFKLFDKKFICPAKKFFEFQELVDLPHKAYELDWLLDLDPVTLPFDDYYLTLPASCIQTFMRIRHDTEWFHVMYRSPAISSFFKVLDEERGTIRMLPYFCWCDGGKGPIDRYRQHRHMILVSLKKGHFESVQGRITADDKPCSNYNCKTFKRIQDPLHLLNTIVYLSKRESRCNFSFDRKLNEKCLLHFYAFTPTYIDCQLALATVWEGGLMQLIHQLYKNIEPKSLALAPIQRDPLESRWGIKLKHVLDSKFDIILPVPKDFVPTSKVTQYYFYLCGDRKMYFEKLEAPLPEDEWIQRQVAGGNVLSHAIGEIVWVFKPHIQRYLNANQLLIDEMVDSRKQCESRIAELNQQLESINLENAELKQRLESANLDLASRNC